MELLLNLLKPPPKSAASSSSSSSSSVPPKCNTPLLLLLGVSLGLLISAFLFATDMATRLKPLPFSPPPLSPYPAHLLILLFRAPYRYASASSSDYNYDHDLQLFPPDAHQSNRTNFPSLISDENDDDASSSATARSQAQGHHHHPSSSSSFLTRAQTPADDSKYCNLSVGKWVQDDSYPFYTPSSCPFVDEGFSCQQNGRPDSEYAKWRWVPRDCNLPRFNGTELLEELRGKRVVFVGDSLNRNQWESMLCMLRESLQDKQRIVQLHGGRISKLPGAYVFKFLDYDCKIEFYTSPYLVDQRVEINSTRSTITLDKMDLSERRWRKANVLVFNTGHWWTPDKIGNGENCFQEGNLVHAKMDVMAAYKKALLTWATWVDRYVNPAETTVFFRGYSPVHYIGGQWNSGGQCQNETEPIERESYLSPYPEKMQVLEEVVSKMRVGVHVLNITRLSDYRKDAHPATYGHPPHEQVLHQDCSHWCLPGLPDTWNELLYSALTRKILII